MASRAEAPPPFKDLDMAHLDILASACRPASVIRTRTTSVCRPAATMRSRFVVASPAVTSSTIMSIENQCARRIALLNRDGLRQAIRGRGGGQDWDGDSGVGSASVHSHDYRPDPPRARDGPGLVTTN